MTYEKLRKFIIYMRWMQEKDLDVLTIISSPKGFGKSSFIIQCARMYNSIFGLSCKGCNQEWIYTGKAINPKGKGIFAIKDNLYEPCPKCKGTQVGKPKKFNFDLYLAYDNIEVREKVFDLPPYSPILADEGVRFMMGEDWMTSESKQMKKLFAQMRTKHMLVFANIPRFRWVDSKYRNDMTTFWVRIMFRSFAMVLQPDLGEAKDPWHLKDLEKLMGNYQYFTSEEQLTRIADKLVRKHPCCFDYFKFPKVPNEIYKEYLIARNKKAFERRDETQQIDQKQLAKIVTYNLMQNWEQILGAVKSSKKKSPTLKILEQFAFVDPNSQEPVVTHMTISNWNKEIKKLVKV